MSNDRVSKFIVVGALVFLAGCTGETAVYVDSRLLHDSDGCVFFARRNVGDTIFLRHIKESSSTTCKLGGQP